uniref:CDP-diacylglycerol--glycerol-3-phosphate 3-phosphatidyltransferase n=1 Tax=Brassica campestris TaxID=3711 RepID=M4EBR7_BRACM
MLRSSLASLIVDLNLRRTLRHSSPAAHLSRSSGCVFAPRHSSHKAITFRVQRCRPHHRVTPSFSSSSYPPPPSSSSKVLTLPTVLTLCRVAAVPLLVASRPLYTCKVRSTLMVGGEQLPPQASSLLDPVADKLMVAATLILLCTKPIDVAVLGPVPWLLTVPSIAIIGREITMSAVREWAASQNGKLLEAVAVNNLGKWKTATQMTALTILLASRDRSVGWLVASGAGLLYVSAGLSVWSLLVYMRMIWKVLLK